MPNYFEASEQRFPLSINRHRTHSRRQSSPKKIAGNTFKIKTDKPNVKVSWQVTGIRHDKFAEDKQTRRRTETNRRRTKANVYMRLPAGTIRNAPSEDCTVPSDQPEYDVMDFVCKSERASVLTRKKKAQTRLILI